MSEPVQAGSTVHVTEAADAEWSVILSSDTELRLARIYPTGALPSTVPIRLRDVVHVVEIPDAEYEAKAITRYQLFLRKRQPS